MSLLEYVVYTDRGLMLVAATSQEEADRLAITDGYRLVCKCCQGDRWLNAGPNGQPKCPHCRNSSQNAVIWNDEKSRRCANCKTVFVPVPCPLCSKGVV